MSESTGPRRLRLILAVAGVVLVVAAALAWLNRRQIARDTLVGWLKAKGVPAEAQVDAVGPHTFIARLRLGDPARPDLTVERAEVHYRLGLGAPQVSAVTLTRPVLRASFRGGRLSAGSLDPLVRDFLARPPQPGAPKPTVTIDQGRLLLATDYGALSLNADARVAEGRLQSLSAIAAPTILRGRAFAAELGTVRLSAIAQGGELKAQAAAPVVAAVLGGARLKDGALNLTLAAPYPDLTRGRLDTPFTLDAAFSAAEGRTASAVVVGARGTARLDGALAGVPQAPSLQGRADVRLAADRAQTAKLTLAHVTLAARGDGEARRGALEGRLRLSGGGEGAWSGLGPPTAGEVPQVAALKRAARSFRLQADAVDLTLHDGRSTVALPQPLRLVSTTGLRAQLTSRGALLGPDGGGFQAAAQGGGLPDVVAEVSRLTIDGGDAEAIGRLRVKGALGLAQGADLDAAGRLTVRSGRVLFSAESCADIAAARLELGVNDVERVAARLCPAGAPLFAWAGGRWRLAGRAEAVRADAPFLQVRGEGGAGPVTIDGVAGRLTAHAAVQALTVRDTAPTARFNPVGLAGAVALADRTWTADFAAREASGHALGTARLVHDGGVGAGYLALDTGVLTFAEGGLQPAELSPLTAAIGPPVTGRAAFHGRIDWASRGVASSGTLTLDGLDFTSAAGKVEGLKGTVAFQSLNPLAAAPGLAVEIAKVDAIVPVTELSGQVGVANGALTVAGGHADVGGGQIRIESLEVPFATQAPVRGVLLFDGVQLHDLVEASPFADRVDLDARVSGRIPFTAGEGGVRIQGGSLKAIQPGRLSIQRTALTSVKAQGQAAGAPAQAANPNDTFTDFAYQALENLAFDTLDAAVQSQADGRLGVLFHIAGRHDPPQKQEIRLGVMDLIRKRFLGRKLPLPSGTQVNLTLDTTLNLDDLLADYAEFRRLHGSAGVQP